MRGGVLAFVFGAGMLAGTAAAQQPILTFGFTDLNGGFTSTGLNQGIFSATSDPSDVLGTAGDVTRDGETADFDAGTIGLPGVGLFSLQLNVANITATSATALGTFTIVDADGERITGNVAGTWFFTGSGLAFLNAETSNVVVESDGGPSTFDGTSGGSFSIADLDSVFSGGLSVLFLRSGGFQRNFQGVATQVDGLIIPAPATTAGLLALGGLAAARRRR